MMALLGGLAARLVGTVGINWALGLLGVLGLSSGLGIGYLGGKVSGHFNCNERIYLATEKARSAALQRDLEISKRVSKSDRELAAKLQKALDKARKEVDAIQDKADGSCGLSKSDVKRLRNIR